MTSEYDVVIVGGGPVGMGLAIDLGQRGARVAVIERYGEVQPIPKGQNLTQRTMENIAAWGCEVALRAARVMPPGVANGGLVTYGTLLSDYSYDWLPREKVQPFYWRKVERLPQYATERVLRARVAELDTVEVIYDAEFAGLVQDENGVTVSSRRRGGSDLSEVRGRYVVGCDGSRSAVREAAGITQTLSDHDKRMLLLVFRSPELHEMLGARYEPRAFYNALSPDLDGYWLFLGRVDVGSEWFFHAPVPLGTTRDNFDFKGFLHSAVGKEFPLDIEHIGFWDLRVAVADTYRRDRVFIAGDAAHSHPPYGGYGINTGFEDARNLAWKLDAERQGWAGGRLLDSYDAERRPVFASTARDFIERFIVSDREFLKNFNPQKDLSAFEAAWYARNEGSDEVHKFEPNYEGSPVVWGPEGAKPSARGRHVFTAEAGHHLAPRDLPSGGNVYEQLGPGFTLIALGAGAPDVAAITAAASALSVPLTVVEEPDCPARADYGARLILVRPDAFVAWAGDRTGDRSREILAFAVGR